MHWSRVFKSPSIVGSSSCPAVGLKNVFHLVKWVSCLCKLMNMCFFHVNFYFQANLNRTKASVAQLTYLSEHMQANTSMANGQISHSLQERAELERQWKELTDKLNSLGGPIKSTAKWKQAWRDLKSNVKKKAIYNRMELRGHGTNNTGNGPCTFKGRSVKEEQVFSVTVEDDDVVTEPTQKNESPVSSQSRSVQQKRMRPLPVPPESGPKRRRIISRQEAYDVKLLSIHEEIVKLKKERNAIEQRRNIIAQEKNDAFNRIADILEKMM